MKVAPDDPVLSPEIPPEEEANYEAEAEAPADHPATYSDEVDMAAYQSAGWAQAFTDDGYEYWTNGELALSDVGCT